MNSLPRSQPKAVDSEEPLRAPEFWRYAAQGSTVGLFLLALTVCLDLARPILVPVVSAIVIGTMLGPLSRRAAASGVPSWLFSSLTLLIILVLLQALTILVSGPVVEWIGKAPELGSRIGARLEAMRAAYPWLGAFGNLLASPAELLSKLDVTSYLQSVVAFVTPALGQLVVFFATLFFFLLERSELRRDLVLVFRDQDDRLRALRILNDLEYKLTRYIGIVSVINIVLGVVAGLGAWALGLPSPLLLGVVAFVLNYLPYIGPAVMLVILLVLGILTYPTLTSALIPPALFVALTTLEGHFITPNIVGQSFTLNPLAVFLCLAFWTWLWGPIGAFLSVPFLIIGLVILNHVLIKPDAELPG